MKKSIVYFLLFLILAVDIGYSYQQFLGQPLDGDMAWNLVPDPGVQHILDSPLGLKAISENQAYPNPNRFFCHWTFKAYLVQIPLYLQQFMTPIESVYMATAIAKTGIQILLITLLAMIISGTRKIKKISFLLSAVLVIPFFQTNGYQAYMGIIDKSTTYSFFYALPTGLLLLYFIPFYWFIQWRKKAPNLLWLLWTIPLAVIVSLSGPLNPGIALILSLLLIIKNMGENFQNRSHPSLSKKVASVFFTTPKSHWIFLLPISIFSLYSLFLGRYNLITIDTQISLGTMYSRIPEGIFFQFFQKLGFPILFAFLLLNYLLIKRNIKTKEAQDLLKAFKWFGFFTLLYILLLPLGGYREYRPRVLRYDTILPITLGLIILYGKTSLLLIKQLTLRQKKWYIPLLIGMFAIFTNADKPEFNNNQCEKNALLEISKTKEQVLPLQQDCTVLNWFKATAPKQTEQNAQLLLIWNITDQKVLYYHE